MSNRKHHARWTLCTRCCDQLATVQELEDMYETQREVSYTTFAKHVDTRVLSRYLGYAHGRHAEGLRLKKDYAVHFYRAKFRGALCYAMDWARIDHIFLAADDARAFIESHC